MARGMAAPTPAPWPGRRMRPLAQGFGFNVSARRRFLMAGPVGLAMAGGAGYL